MQFSLIAASLAAFGAKYASAEALPEAFAKAMANPQEASYQCHSDCGYAILAARKCDTTDTDCLCNDDSMFASLAPACLDCGWCLYTDYFDSLTDYLEACDYPTTPTGTLCAEDATLYGFDAVSSAETDTPVSSANGTAISSVVSNGTTAATTGVPATSSLGNSTTGGTRTTGTVSGSSSTTTGSVSASETSATTASSTDGAVSLQVGAGVVLAGVLAMIV